MAHHCTAFGAEPERAGGPAVRGASGARDFAHYLVRKIAAAVVSFAVLLVFGFVIFSLIPADPVADPDQGAPHQPEADGSS